MVGISLALTEEDLKALRRAITEGMSSAEFDNDMDTVRILTRISYNIDDQVLAN